MYRPLSWDDFRGPVAVDEPYVGARTYTQIALSSRVDDGRYTFSAVAYFLPDSSFVRLRTANILRHEQCHFSIAYLEALKCMRLLRPLQEGNVTVGPLAEKIWSDACDSASRRSDQFDRETNNSNNILVEKLWEERISREIRTFEIPSKTPNGRYRKNS